MAEAGLRSRRLRAEELSLHVVVDRRCGAAATTESWRDAQTVPATGDPPVLVVVDPVLSSPYGSLQWNFQWPPGSFAERREASL